MTLKQNGMAEKLTICQISLPNHISRQGFIYSYSKEVYSSPFPLCLYSLFLFASFHYPQSTFHFLLSSFPFPHPFFSTFPTLLSFPHPPILSPPSPQTIFNNLPQSITYPYTHVHISTVLYTECRIQDVETCTSIHAVCLLDCLLYSKLCNLYSTLYSVYIQHE